MDETTYLLAETKIEAETFVARGDDTVSFRYPPFSQGYDAGVRDRREGTFTQTPEPMSAKDANEWRLGYHAGHMSQKPKEESTP